MKSSGESIKLGFTTTQKIEFKKYMLEQLAQKLISYEDELTRKKILACMLDIGHYDKVYGEGGAETLLSMHNEIQRLSKNVRFIEECIEWVKQSL